MLWNMCNDFEITLKAMDDEMLVYHCGSGNTHRLGGDARVLLCALKQVDQAVTTEWLVLHCKTNSLEKDDLGLVEGVLQTLSNWQCILKIDK